MRSAYIFNPDNDLALANGTDNYTAPKMARRIRNDLQLIPLWFADSGSSIIAEYDTVNESFVADNLRMFPQLGAIDLSERGAEYAMPWGWSRAIRSELKRLNVSILPDTTHLDEFRQLSHRRTSVAILSEIGYRGIMPLECFSLFDVQRYVSLYGETVVKAPWSCSGRGVFLVNRNEFDRSKDLIAGIISKQGSVMCEKFLNKQSDFALEFRSDETGIRFQGYSIFSNGNRFSYEKAIVADTSTLKSILLKEIDEQVLDSLCERLQIALSRIVPDWYRGYLGVDMMTFPDNGSLQVMPCVELNLRTTMGLLSSKLGDRILAPGRIGEMTITCRQTHDAVIDYVKNLAPPKVEADRLIGGSLLLVPPKHGSIYTAVLTVV
ncbi:MAG: hypothetical protein PUE90_03480 [Bacteroidales bacterium]|nr:hypothetical protein [Bacteroidales bacterium]